MSEETAALAVNLKGITKTFGSLIALDQVDFDLRVGEIHAIVGENGAGKTTLMNCLFGLLQPDEGEIIIGGQKHSMLSPRQAAELGVGMVHQHFKLVPNFTVAQNVFLGHEIKKFGIVRAGEQNNRIKEISERYGLDVTPTDLIAAMSVGMRQRVEILRALSRKVRVLVLDEPTAVLTTKEVHHLFSVLKNLVKDGLSIIFISHHLEEVSEIADRLTILRNGKKVITDDINNFTEAEIARMMIGRELKEAQFDASAPPGRVLLSTKNLKVSSTRGIQVVRGIDLVVRAGEIVGIAGIAANGQSELVEAIIGLRKPDDGTIHFGGKDITMSLVGEVRHDGMGNIPEDRLLRGVNPFIKVSQNIYSGFFDDDRFGKFLLDYKKINQHTHQLIESYDIRGADTDTIVKNLSGGNIQKVVLARELSRNPSLVVAAEPSRGLDVGAIEFVHKQLDNLRDIGAGILLVSTELDEVLSLSDRIMIINKGRIMTEFSRANIPDDQKLSNLMLGIKEKE